VDDSTSFLEEPSGGPRVQAVHEESLASDGYVPNYVRTWCWRPDVLTAFADLRSALVGESSLSPGEVAVLVVATASTLGDSYCSLAWGERLAGIVGEEAASEVLNGEDRLLSGREAALAAWARQIVRDPNGTTADDVRRLRDVGFDEQEIFEATAWIGLRLGFSAVNDALGIRPDRELAERVPETVGATVTFGRSPQG
jgi:uncharacterized peroxidase-related enzyme